MDSIGNPPDDIDVFLAEMEKELALLEKELKQQSSNTSSALDHWYSPHYNHVRFDFQGRIFSPSSKTIL